jgi:muramoyltetrapeptide carboxypeptidase
MRADMLIKPRAIPSSAHFAILAASGPSERQNILDGARVIEARGHRVTIAGNISHRHRGYLAGSDDERAAELNRHLRDPQYDAFLFARGGYGAMRILDRIDYAALAENARPLIGFSDVTAIHQALAVKANLASFHGPMINLDFRNGLTADIDSWFWSMLRGDAMLTRRFTRDDVLFEGEAEGTLFGGCLALTVALVGTPYDFWIDDGIWFWEDVDEPVYRLDRMLTHLWLSGRMHRVRAVVIGALKDCGNRAELIDFLHEFFGPLRIPVVHNLPFGHHGNNLMMPIGRTVRLSTADHTFTVIEPAVTTT